MDLCASSFSRTGDGPAIENGPLRRLENPNDDKGRIAQETSSKFAQIYTSVCTDLHRNINVLESLYNPSSVQVI
eukprot:7527119-Pyramimonas_sp.AAC.1